ncbi:MAG: GTP-binding protein, partial [Aquisalimonadaceae bacterium]
MTERRSIPVNLITGFLGVGKSTAIRHLLESAPKSERWAVLVNEFGQVAVDPAALDTGAGSDRVTIRELPGGCLCCVLGAPLRVTLTRLIREVRPDRLLIEPSGIGHPARVLDTLRGEGLGSVLDVRATVCLVDPRQLQDRRVSEHPVFRDQVELADVLVANKQDLADAETLAGFHAWAMGQFPPKARVAGV